MSVDPSKATFSVQLDINADGGLDVPNGDGTRSAFYPPERVLDVCVVDAIAFLQVKKYDEDAASSTLTNDGVSCAVDLRALLYALASQAPVDFVRALGGAS